MVSVDFVRMVSMNLELSEEQATELSAVLDDALNELHGEIASTDNPGYRNGLRHRLTVLQSVKQVMVSGS